MFVCVCSRSRHALSCSANPFTTFHPPPCWKTKKQIHAQTWSYYQPAVFTRFPLKYLCFFYLIFTHTDMVILSASGIQEVSSVIHTHTHTHTHVYIYIHTQYIYTHTHTHTHRHGHVIGQRYSRGFFGYIYIFYFHFFSHTQTWSYYRLAVCTWFLHTEIREMTCLRPTKPTPVCVFFFYFTRCFCFPFTTRWH